MLINYEDCLQLLFIVKFILILEYILLKEKVEKLYAIQFCYERYLERTCYVYEQNLAI